tara:strand:+ start:2389 stop:2751 length:363 start_codon:yes stop_codon:yes gene_type:complete
MLLADLILIIHFFIIIFIISLFALVPYGYYRKWNWVSRKKIRYTHLFLMTLVTIESFIGIICPLTILENHLRGTITNQSFLSKHLSKIIFFNFPSSFFLALYFSGFLGAVYLSFKYPPKN